MLNINIKKNNENKIIIYEEFIFDKINISWKPFFVKEFKKKYFFILINKIKKEYEDYKCWPKKSDIFRLFREISLFNIKVILIGQDPYYTPGVADGLAFSTKKKNYIPISLKNIFLEMCNDLKCEIPKKGDLSPWLKEGIFLINSSLTVRNNQPLSHSLLWKDFIFNLINYLDKNKKIIWIFWGQKAKEIKEKHKIESNRSIVSSHPSPFSAKYGFFGSKPFSKTNEIFIKLKIKPVNWLKILI